jgi:hypothetical protein
MINQIKFPAILIGQSYSMDLISNPIQLTRTTTLTLKKNTLKGCDVFDSISKCFKVVEVNKIRTINPWWRFEFFNPQIEIGMTIEENKSCSFEAGRQKVISSINEHPQYWENELDISQVVNTVNGCTGMADVISFLCSIRNIQ